MSWAEITEGGGSGSFGLRLEIEGWPCFFVTHEMITWATGKDGRAQVVGLQYSGIRTSERAVLHRADLRCGSIAFKIVPQCLKYLGVSPTDDCLLYLSQEGQPVDRLAVARDHDDAAFTWSSGTTYASGTVLHIGTETIRSTGSGNFTRHIWGTQEQAHPISANNDHDQYQVYAYTFPPTMEGRRASLYAYALGDDMDSNGAILWRGIVADVPKLDTDGSTWVIECEPVTHVLKQDLAGSLVEAHVVGIHHHRLSPFVVWVKFGGFEYGPFKYTAWDAHEVSLFGSTAPPAALGTGLSDFLEDCIVDEAGAASFFDSIQFGRTGDGALGIILKRSSDAAEEFIIKGGSVLLGFFDSEDEGFVSSSQAATASGHTAGAFRTNVLDPGETYFIPLSPSAAFAVNDVVPNHAYADAPVTALGDGRELIKPRWERHFQDSSALAIANYPAWRIYVDTDLSGATALAITGTNKMGGAFVVADTGTIFGKSYVDIEPTQGLATTGLGAAANHSYVVDLLGFLTADTTITAIRNYAGGDVSDFIEGLKATARDNANRGDTPFITDADITGFSIDGPISALALWRKYTFVSKLSLLDVLREEVKFINHFMRLEGDGTIGIAPLPSWTEATPVDALHEIGPDDILTPPHAARWPGWAPNKDGRATEVLLQQQYDGMAKEHRDEPVVVREGSVIPVTKQKGTSPVEIKPFSEPGVQLPDAQTRAELVAIARRVLSFAAIQYDVVTFTVPYTKLGILVGDIVSITSDKLVAGDGTKGVTDRRGVVIEKQVNFDPADRDRVDLTVLLTARSMIGYAPSAVATFATNTTGNTWEIECSSLIGLNALLSTDPDGRVLLHFAVDDLVRVFEGDAYTPTEVLGTVTAIDLSVSGSETITVAFDDVWAPAIADGEILDLWILEFQRDNADGDFSTTSQRRYAYVGQQDGVLAGGGYPRRLS